MAQKNGLIFQHRRVWFDCYGEIPKDHVIHHKNGNKKDNRITNLECLTRSQHTKHHCPYGTYGKPTTYLTLKCGQCKKTFQRQKWRHEQNMRFSNKKDYEPLCSDLCNGRSVNKTRWDKHYQIQAKKGVRPEGLTVSKINFNGVSLSRKEWAKHLDIDLTTLTYRLEHWPLDKALSKEKNKNKVRSTLAQKEKDN